MERKNNKGLIVLVIILLIRVIGLGGHIVYDKVITKDTKSKTENSSKKESIEKNKLNN